MFTSLATDIDDPVERLRAIQRVDEGRQGGAQRASAPTCCRTGPSSPGPTRSTSRRASTRASKLADTHRPIHNVIISNVPGPPFPLYYAGAELVAAYPMGPVMEGAGLNITVFSYRDSVDFGFMACRELVPDVWAMADAVEEAFDELLAVARAQGSPKRAQSARKRKPAPA